ncbi:ribonuclease Z [Candidatus Vecturithrix granuli]|uniref:Ribonuclease Z n=1 Tax=Vecturithrix granuli TaxID=1499967 RepID=A0A081C9A2_VECG1|nr:ribonuclease Z [Candidatus Vecturithrix granuli]
MKIKPRLGGGKSGDPSLYIDIVDRKRAILFDCGLNNFRPAALHKVTDVFISHTHIDHFIGFDALLRLNLTEEKIIHVYGPPGICRNVIGKLQGYTWNICQNLRLIIVVHEILPETIVVTSLESWRGFEIKQTEEQPHTDLLLDTGEFSVKYLELDHKTPCFGYTFLEAESCNVRKEALEELGLQPGPWAGQLKAQAFPTADQDAVIQIDGMNYSLDELARKLLVRKPGVKITYLTDFLLHEADIARIIEFTRYSDFLFCEAAFIEHEREKARLTHHLTAREAGILAHGAQVKQLVLFHFSRRYQDHALMLDEARQEFPWVE